ncbi:MAG: 4-hydroxy-3-methylbut-2-enyl diphosphate reductase, partial [Ghiorsea sp.]
LVTKVHLELLRHYANGNQIILIGHAGHPEVEGTMGQAPDGAVLLVSEPEDVLNLQVNDVSKLAFVTQTTLSVDDTKDVITALQKHFPLIQAPKKEDICYATSNRQAAVKDLAAQCDVVLVIGSTNSSNSNRLREVAEKEGCKAYLIENAAAIDVQALQGLDRIGVTAGASAPEVLIEEVIALLTQHDKDIVQQLQTVEENVHFSIPKALQA